MPPFLSRLTANHAIFCAAVGQHFIFNHDVAGAVQKRLEGSLGIPLFPGARNGTSNYLASPYHRTVPYLGTAHLNSCALPTTARMPPADS